ncbi:unnamed protein product [Arabidopsis halleri]
MRLPREMIELLKLLLLIFRGDHKDCFYLEIEVHRIFCQKLQQWTQFGLNLQDWPDSIDGNGFQIMVKSFRHSFYNNAGALVGVYRDEEAKGPLEAYTIHICLPNLCKQEEHFGDEL